MDQLLTRKEVAEILRVKPDTLRKYAKAGQIKVFANINGRPRYRAQDLQELLKLKTA